MFFDGPYVLGAGQRGRFGQYLCRPSTLNRGSIVGDSPPPQDTEWQELPSRAASPRPALARQIKRFAERLLVGARLSAAGRLWHRHRTVILAYHNIVPDGETAAGDRSLHLPRTQFARQLDRLATTHEVVGLDQLLSEAPRTDRPRAIVTFDDAYRGSLQIGLPELTRREMPATVFVAPGLLDDRSFWWDLMSSRETGEVSPALRDRMLTSLRGEHDRVLQDSGFDPGDFHPLPPHSRSATEGELAAAVRNHDVLLGSHTWSHPNLNELGDVEISDELRRSCQWLTERFSATVPWLAYPYGLTSDRVARLAQEVFDGAFSLTGRLAPSSLEGKTRYRVPRINIPAGLSLEGFELRISGIVRK